MLPSRCIHPPCRNMEVTTLQMQKRPGTSPNISMKSLRA